MFAEMARLSHALHWSLDTVLDLSHADRRRFLLEVAAIDQGAAAAAGGWPA
jgi:hypothetical protein